MSSDIKQRKQTYNFKIIIFFIVIFSFLAISILVMGYYQETKFEKITKKVYLKKYEVILAQVIKNSLNKLSKTPIKYNKNQDISLDNNVDCILAFKDSKFLPNTSRCRNKNININNNFLGFQPKNNTSGITKINSTPYLYTSKIKDGTKFVLLKQLKNIPIIAKIGNANSRHIPKTYSMNKINGINFGLSNKKDMEGIIIFDKFKKPIAIFKITPSISEILSTHYKIVLHIFIFALIASLISAMISYIFIKHAVLDNIHSIIDSIKNIHQDLTYTAPKFKDIQFQILANTLEKLTKRIKENEYLFNNVANLIPIGIIVYKDTPVYVNRYAVDFFGKNIINTPLDYLIKEKHKKMAKCIKEKRLKGYSFQASYNIELNTPPDRIIRISSTTIKYKGSSAGLMAFLDVTKNERVKKIYKMINKINDVIIQANHEQEMLNDICSALVSNECIHKAIITSSDSKTIIQKIKDETDVNNCKHSSSVTIPILINGKPEYKMTIESNADNFFDHSTKPMISQITVNIGLAIEHMRIQQEKTNMLLYDSLTGLKNFNSLKNDLRRTNSCVLIYINIRNFSIINQIYGFTISDKILNRLGNLLRKNIKRTDEVYRLHGDKFAILIKKEMKRKNIESMIKRIQNLLIKFEIDSRKIPIHTDIGVTISPSLISKDKVIESVEVALTKSKETKNICFYSKKMKKDIEENFKLETYVRNAIEKNLFSFHYQPIFNIRNKTLEKAEALIRLRDESGNFINPEKFISIAEKVNIINDLTKIVIENVFREISILQNINISINLSSKDTENEEIIKFIEDNIAKYNLTSRKIAVELTERDVMHNFQSTKKFIEKLRNLNIEVEIDDFGIGYSSFDRIVDLDFDVLKIDKSLIDLIGLNRKAEQIITYIIKLAHSLKAKALAEGIETKEQFDFLTKSDCDYVQGYYISKPLPFDEFIKFIKQK